jgi:hypothetical protein
VPAPPELPPAELEVPPVPVPPPSPDGPQPALARPKITTSLTTDTVLGDVTRMSK